VESRGEGWRSFKPPELNPPACRGVVKVVFATVGGGGGGGGVEEIDFVLASF